MAASHPLLANLLAGSLEGALSGWMALAPNRQDLLAPLAGKVIALTIRPFGGSLYFCPTEASVQVLGEFSGTPDTTLSGTISAFARQALGGAARDSLAPGEIEVDGDTDTARRFQVLLDSLDIDWEAQLARYTGGGIAASALGLLRAGTTWTRATVDTLRTDLAEFWQEESRELPARPEAEAFLNAVDILRADADRLEARIQRLEAVRTSTSAA
jgi:ubiquinone biosynthesis protein UbiJ